MHRVVVLAFVLALAGCSDTPTSGGAEEEFEALDLRATSTTGVIRGVVIDPSIVPIPGAMVKLVGKETKVTTDAGGIFGFDGLEGGTYFLEVSKPGYGKVQQSASVQAGVAKPPIVKIQLQRIPGSEPFVVPSQYHGFISCGLLVANVLVGGGNCAVVAPVFGANDDRHFFPVDPRAADFLQTEVIWEENQPGGDRLTLTTYACDQEGDCSSSASGGQRMCQIWGPSPRVCKVTSEAGMGNPDGTGGGAGLNATGFGTGAVPGFMTWIGADCAEVLCVPGTALGVGVVLDQDFDVFNHVFYNFRPAEDWLFIENGPPPVPGGSA